MSPAIRDEHFNYTHYAVQITDEITEAVEPIFKKCMKDGMSHADFFYVACTAIHEMGMFDLLDRQPKA